jgi:hypothetical protein
MGSIEKLPEIRASDERRSLMSGVGFFISRKRFNALANAERLA